MHPASWNAWTFFSIPASSPLTFIIKNAVVMWGPGIAALVTLAVYRDRHRRTIRIFGTSRTRSLLFYWMPIIIAAIVGMPLPDGTVNRPLVLGLGLVTMFTVMGEELGWRGFLQDALRPLVPWKRYVVIGVLWEFWHFTNRTTHGTLGQRLTMLAIFYPVGILLSAIIGEATDRGRALLIAITLHAWFDIVFTFPGDKTYLALALSIPIWIVLLWKWKATNVQRTV
jgi:hypothetical protein